MYAIAVFGGIMFFTLQIQLSYLLTDTFGVQSPGKIGALIAVGSLSVPLGSFAFRRAARFPVSLQLLLAFALIGLSFVLMSRAHSVPELMVWVVVNQFGCGMLLPSMVVWVMGKLQFEIRGRGTGYLHDGLVDRAVPVPAGCHPGRQAGRRTFAHARGIRVVVPGRRGACDGESSARQASGARGAGLTRWPVESNPQTLTVAASTGYTRTAVSLHWLIAGLIISAFALGWVMTELAISPLKVRMFNWHKWVGMTILALAALRTLWRLTHPAPPLLPMPAWQRISAHALHGLLYAMMFALPLSGWAYSNATGYPIVYLGPVAPAGPGNEGQGAGWRSWCRCITPWAGCCWR